MPGQAAGLAVSGPRRVIRVCLRKRRYAQACGDDSCGGGKGRHVKIEPLRAHHLRYQKDVRDGRRIAVTVATGMRFAGQRPFECSEAFVQSMVLPHVRSVAVWCRRCLGCGRNLRRRQPPRPVSPWRLAPPAWRAGAHVLMAACSKASAGDGRRRCPSCGDGCGECAGGA